MRHVDDSPPSGNVSHFRPQRVSLCMTHAPKAPIVMSSLRSLMTLRASLARRSASLRRTRYASTTPRATHPLTINSAMRPTVKSQSADRNAREHGTQASQDQQRPRRDTHNQTRPTGMRDVRRPLRQCQQRDLRANETSWLRLAYARRTVALGSLADKCWEPAYETSGLKQTERPRYDSRSQASVSNLCANGLPCYGASMHDW
jgi:hypothetical protein